jgi:hypothetical protein
VREPNVTGGMAQLEAEIRKAETLNEAAFSRPVCLILH